ncbi:hypothetical protein [Ectothiorhodospira mobilis]|uniref:hypothetical protein n=1 Tax=Ectothiorhodospira mobilis TaxID=195064 RepID=UPI0019053E87|nr:hypothetical protein [Ectothiorhodospira mobilis]MBK1692669.1 hypothetical protein [Ectothiorhodospira mobilis]
MDSIRQFRIHPPGYGPLSLRVEPGEANERLRVSVCARMLGRCVHLGRFAAQEKDQGLRFHPVLTEDSTLLRLGIRLNSIPDPLDVPGLLHDFQDTILEHPTDPADTTRHPPATEASGEPEDDLEDLIERERGWEPQPQEPDEPMSWIEEAAEALSRYQDKWAREEAIRKLVFELHETLSEMRRRDREAFFEDFAELWDALDAVVLQYSAKDEEMGIPDIHRDRYRPSSPLYDFYIGETL